MGNKMYSYKEWIFPPPKPWRIPEENFNFSEEYYDKLKKKVVDSGVLKGTRQFLLFGPTSSGKSSFINSVLSLGRTETKKLTYIASAGSAGDTLTREFMCYNGTDWLKNCKIGDTAGVLGRDDAGLHQTELLMLVQGQIKQGYVFGKSASENKKFIDSEPKEENKMHCVVLMCDSEKINAIDNDDGKQYKAYINKIKDFLDKIHDKGIPVIAVLTKIDRVSESVENDITQVYTCEKIKEVVEKCEYLLGIPKMVIFPVKNYSSEQCRETNKDIILLLALEKIFNCISDRTEQKIPH